jgi:hypothetical protein
MQRNQIALAVAALAVCCLGALTITTQRTELLVGSYHVGPAIPGKPTHHAQGFGVRAHYFYQLITISSAGLCCRWSAASSNGCVCAC